MRRGQQYAVGYLEGMLESGRIARQDYDRLRQALRPREEGYESYGIPGYISVKATSQSELIAASRLLNTPELLEMILTHLSPSDLLLRAQLSCRGFQETIKASPTIRRKMFLDTNVPTAPLRAFPYKFKDVYPADARRQRYRIWDFPFFDVNDGTFIYHYDDLSFWSGVDGRAGYDFCLTGKRLRELASTPALKNMQMFQPPPLAVQITLRYDADFACVCCGEADVVEIGSGMTAGGVFSVASHAMEKRFAGCLYWNHDFLRTVFCKAEMEGRWERMP